MTVEEPASYGRFPHKRGFRTLGREDFEIIRESLRIAGIENLREIYQIEAELVRDVKTGKPICLFYENCTHE